MKYDPLDLHADFRCRRNISAHADHSVGIYSEETRGVRVFDWCPGPATILLQFYLLVSHKQRQVILRICIILQSDFYMTHKISDVT
jgi:hypothetical protein